jgi:chitinase
MCLRGRALLACVLGLVCTSGVAACGDDSSTPAPADSGSPKVAPYLDIVSGDADLAGIYAKTGQASFTAAFVVADSAGNCTPTWGGTAAIGDGAIKASIDEITANGGKVIVATGGETGTYLEAACSASELASAYEKALDAAGSNYLDVDVEQAVDPATVTSALATLQKARGTAITLTLPVDGTEAGLTDAAIALLTRAKDAGVEVTVNAMTMNFDAIGDWGAAMTTATEAVKDDVAGVWSGRTDAQVYAMLGVTPMIGVNDTGGTTTPADAKTLLAWASSKGLGFVRFWSVNRDNGGCTDGSVRPTCSGIDQDDYAFTSLFKGYDS